MSVEKQDVVKTGADTPLLDRTKEAPSFYVDGVQGATLSAHVAKLNFIEEFLDPSDHLVKRRVALIMVVPRNQLKKVGELMVKMAEENVPESDDE